MERYKCRFCFKSFINGSALGGHMRSHMLTLSSSKRDDLYQERPSQLSEETESDASSSSSDAGETESSRINPTRRRSKRTRKLGSFDLDFKKLKTSQAGETEHHHHHSSASDTTTEEDLAFCLIMLSRDKWKQHKTVVEEEEDDDDDDDDDESDHECKNRGGRGRFKCETCGKVFKSYQALGGHRASHKKNKTFTKTEHEKTEYSVNGGVGEKKIHQCPICFRVFSSGQALGGHKRSHGINNIVVPGRVLSVNHIIPKEVSVKQRMIDLNFPAPNEDDEPSVVFDEW